ncbi:10595_t:CDS:2, partial [Dentiscutata heterogama]
MGPDNIIISCIDEFLDSWKYNWCSLHQKLIVLAWSSLFLKLWTVYQYQYRKGLFLTWLKERKEKIRKKNEVAPYNMNSKNDVINNDVKEIKIVIT